MALRGGVMRQVLVLLCLCGCYVPASAIQVRTLVMRERAWARARLWWAVQVKSLVRSWEPPALQL